MNKHLRTILLLFLVSANAFVQKPVKSISPNAQIGDLKILNAQIPYNTTYSKVEHFTFSAIDEEAKGTTSRG